MEHGDLVCASARRVAAGCARCREALLQPRGRRQHAARSDNSRAEDVRKRRRARRDDNRVRGPGWRYAALRTQGPARQRSAAQSAPRSRRLRRTPHALGERGGVGARQRGRRVRRVRQVVQQRRLAPRAALPPLRRGSQPLPARQRGQLPNTIAVLAAAKRTAALLELKLLRARGQALNHAELRQYRLASAPRPRSCRRRCRRATRGWMQIPAQALTRATASGPRELAACALAATHGQRAPAPRASGARLRGSRGVATVWRSTAGRLHAAPMRPSTGTAHDARTRAHSFNAAAKTEASVRAVRDRARMPAPLHAHRRVGLRSQADPPRENSTRTAGVGAGGSSAAHDAELAVSL